MLLQGCHKESHHISFGAHRRPLIYEKKSHFLVFWLKAVMLLPEVSGARRNVFKPLSPPRLDLLWLNIQCDAEDRKKEVCQEKKKSLILSTNRQVLSFTHGSSQFRDWTQPGRNREQKGHLGYSCLVSGWVTEVERSINSVWWGIPGLRSYHSIYRICIFSLKSTAFSEVRRAHLPSQKKKKKRPVSRANTAFLVVSYLYKWRKKEWRCLYSCNCVKWLYHIPFIWCITKGCWVAFCKWYTVQEDTMTTIKPGNIYTDKGELAINNNKWREIKTALTMRTETWKHEVGTSSSKISSQSISDILESLDNITTLTYLPILAF